jgi:nitroimidazol reductase NimA-like FMN-containing flavoprotein (pyridoxamine 5'-phosphate oxidase superfamily)
MKTYILSEMEQMQAIIDSCSICFVGMVDGDNCPYVIPMNFAFYGQSIILHSAPFGHHLDLIAKNNRVSVTFCSEGKLVYQHQDVACSYRMDSRSVICKGAVAFVEDIARKEELLHVFMKKYTDRSFQYSLPALRNVKIWIIEVEEMTARAFGQKHSVNK